MKNHTWLGITNERQENVYFLDYELRPLETMTISIWPDTSGYKSLGGVYINRERPNTEAVRMYDVFHGKVSFWPAMWDRAIRSRPITG